MKIVVSFSPFCTTPVTVFSSALCYIEGRLSHECFYTQAVFSSAFSLIKAALLYECR